MTTVTGAPRQHHRRLLQSPGLMALLLIAVVFTWFFVRIIDRPAPRAVAPAWAPPTIGPAPSTAAAPPADATSDQTGTRPADRVIRRPWFFRALFLGPLLVLGFTGVLLIGLLMLLLRLPSVLPPARTSTPPPRLQPSRTQQSHQPQQPLPPRAERPPSQPPCPAPPRAPRRPRYLEPTLFVNDGAWKVIAASVQGASHLKTDKPCQDASYSRILPGSLLIGAVADGAGSARFSDEGAQIAVKRAVDTVADAVQLQVGGGASADAPFTTDQWHQVLRAAMQVALGHVELGAALRGTKPRDFATTLLLFAGLRDSLVAAQIGDGAIVIRDRAGRLHAITTPQSGEYANTTTFLVSPGAFDGVQHRVWDSAYTGVAAFTDGLQRLALAMPTGNPHGPFFTPLFDFADRAHDSGTAIEEIDTFLRSSKVAQRADDDLTLMVARKTS